MIWKNKKVLVTGSRGMIAKELIEMLEKKGCQIIPFDIKMSDVCDITSKDVIEAIFFRFEPDYVFHLFGIKGNPRMTNERPVDFMGPMLTGDTNVIMAAQKFGVKKFLYTSSIAVENPKTDKYPAWAKLTAETLIEAMRIQYPKGTKFCIVRPANVYGRFDDFERKDNMVITSLIRKAIHSEVENRGHHDSFTVWGDGNQVRDFINAKDVARGMIQAMSQMPDKPVNLCSGKGVKIKEIVKIIEEATGKEAKFDKSKPTGDKRRVMKLNWDFEPKISIEKGIKEVIEWVS